MVKWAGAAGPDPPPVVFVGAGGFGAPLVGVADPVPLALGVPVGAVGPAADGLAPAAPAPFGPDGPASVEHAPSSASITATTVSKRPLIRVTARP